MTLTFQMLLTSLLMKVLTPTSLVVMKSSQLLQLYSAMSVKQLRMAMEVN